VRLIGELFFLSMMLTNFISTLLGSKSPPLSIMYGIICTLITVTILFRPQFRPPCDNCLADGPWCYNPFDVSLRMWLEGGHYCRNCGSEFDNLCKPIPPDAPMPRLITSKSIVVIILASLVIIGMNLVTIKFVLK
jgi:hypothetical protein